MSRKGWLLFTAMSVVWGIPYLFIKIAVRELDPIVVVALPFDPGERVSGLRLVGLLIGMGGVVTLLGLDVGGDKQRLLGAVLVLLAAMGYAVSALLIKRPAITALPSLGVVTVECLTATIVLTPLAVTRLPSKVPALNVIASLFVLGLICTALAYLFFFALIAEVGASRGAVITYVNPVVSVFLGVTLLGEPLTLAILLGFLLIIIGSWLSTGGVLPPPLGHLLRTRRYQQRTGRDVGGSSKDTSSQQL